MLALQRRPLCHIVTWLNAVSAFDSTHTKSVLKYFLMIFCNQRYSCTIDVMQKCCCCKFLHDSTTLCNYTCKNYKFTVFFAAVNFFLTLPIPCQDKPLPSIVGTRLGLKNSFLPVSTKLTYKMADLKSPFATITPFVPTQS